MTRSVILSDLDGYQRHELLSSDDVETLRPVEARYAIGLTEFLANRIDPADEVDPIERMFIPDLRELDRRETELNDPIGDEQHTPVKGVVHRYPNRVLLKPVGVCPVYCRFCFRREMVGPENGGNLSSSELETALGYVRAHPEVKEVILTGGDPFMLSAKRAKSLTQKIAEIPHVKVIRWHTRMPVADPGRITQDFVEALRCEGVTVYVSVHINHARELSEETAQALARMADAGLPLLSQTVLLRGVNDSADVLAALFGALIENRVRPYYLHHPDLAPGTGHFQVSVDEGQAIYSALRDRLSGIAVPQYVIDIPGGVSKANAARSDVEGKAGDLSLRGRDGRAHPYKP